jgi:hypothetical protein
VGEGIRFRSLGVTALKRAVIERGKSGRRFRGSTWRNLSYILPGHVSGLSHVTESLFPLHGQSFVYDVTNISYPIR